MPVSCDVITSLHLAILIMGENKKNWRRQRRFSLSNPKSIFPHLPSTPSIILLHHPYSGLATFQFELHLVAKIQFYSTWGIYYQVTYLLMLKFVVHLSCYLSNYSSCEMLLIYDWSPCFQIFFGRATTMSNKNEENTWATFPFYFLTHPTPSSKQR